VTRSDQWVQPLTSDVKERLGKKMTKRARRECKKGESAAGQLLKTRKE
jgi:hypothetical protein